MKTKIIGMAMLNINVWTDSVLEDGNLGYASQRSPVIGPPSRSIRRKDRLKSRLIQRIISGFIQ